MLQRLFSRMTFIILNHAHHKRGHRRHGLPETCKVPRLTRACLLAHYLGGNAELNYMLFLNFQGIYIQGHSAPVRKDKENNGQGDEMPINFTNWTKCLLTVNVRINIFVIIQKKKYSSNYFVIITFFLALVNAISIRN